MDTLYANIVLRGHQWTYPSSKLLMALLIISLSRKWTSKQVRRQIKTANISANSVQSLMVIDYPITHKVYYWNPILPGALKASEERATPCINLQQQHPEFYTGEQTTFSMYPSKLEMFALLFSLFLTLRVPWDCSGNFTQKLGLIWSIYTTFYYAFDMIYHYILCCTLNSFLYPTKNQNLSQFSFYASS